MKTKLIQFYLHVIDHRHLHVNVANISGYGSQLQLPRYIRQ